MPSMDRMAEDQAVATSARRAPAENGQPSLRAFRERTARLSLVGDSESPAGSSPLPLHANATEKDTKSSPTSESFKKAVVDRRWSSCWILAAIITSAIWGYITLFLLDTSRQGYFRKRSGVDPFEKWGKAGTGTEKLAWYPTDFLRDVQPVRCHSHNDYWRKVPLFSALYAGCTGVEVDLWLRNGDLLVGHDEASLQPDRTFQSLYVNPLVEILTRQNPHTAYYNGSYNGVFDTDPSQTLVLLIDLKSDGAETWPLVMKQLAPLRERGWLSYYTNGRFVEGPVTVVGTGNTPFSQIVQNATYRDAFFDAPLDQLENSKYDLSNSYYASVSFWKAIGMVLWRGTPNESQMRSIRRHIREAHKRGLKARYWKLPSWPVHVRNNIWEVLIREGIDMLNVDDLEAAARQDWTDVGIF